MRSDSRAHGALDLGHARSTAAAGNDWDSTHRRYNPATGGKGVNKGGGAWKQTHYPQPGVNVTSKHLSLLHGITRAHPNHRCVIEELFRFSTGSDKTF